MKTKIYRIVVIFALDRMYTVPDTTKQPQLGLL